jgi:Tol biopolymer transport system component
MGTRAVVWAAAAMAACGDPAGGAPSDGGSGSVPDAASIDTDGAPLDGAAPCTDEPFLPAPLACAQSRQWVGYWRDVTPSSDGEQVVLVSMDDPPGPPLLASGDERAKAEPWTFSPDGGWMAFRSWYSPRPWNLYAAPITDDGPGQLRTISGPFKVDGIPGEYAWSPDGRKIAYVADQEHEASELWVLDLDDDGYAQRVNPPLEFLGGVGLFEGVPPFEWSPDSRGLLYSGYLDDPEERDLYFTDVSGPSPGPTVRLTSDLAGDVRKFSWSPDARVVSFVVGAPSSAMFVARIGCGGAEGPWRITETGWLERFSADGRSLLYLDNVAGGAEDERALRRADLTVTPPVSTTISESVILSMPVLQPQWSPADERLAMLIGRRLEVLDGATGLRHVVNSPLVANRWVQAYAWSPDGGSIAYTANQEDYFKFELYHVDMSGPAPARKRKVSPTVAHDIMVDSLLWSPDSSHLAYRANQDVAGRQELYAAERADGNLGVPVRMNAPLTRDGALVYQTRWSPDGSRLLYGANDTGAFMTQLFVVALSLPGEATSVADGPDAGEAAWAPCPVP